MNLSTVAPCCQGDRRHLGQVLVEQCGQVLGLQPLGGAGEVLDVGEEDGELLALGGDRDVLLAAEDALVDLRRQILGELHRDRRQEVVGLGQLLVDAADQAGLAALHQDEGEAGRGGEDEVGEQVLEGEQVAAQRLRDRDLLDAAHVADLPVALGAVGMGVVAADADLAHPAPASRSGPGGRAVEPVDLDHRLAGIGPQCRQRAAARTRRAHAARGPRTGRSETKRYFTAPSCALMRLPSSIDRVAGIGIAPGTFP